MVMLSLHHSTAFPTNVRWEKSLCMSDCWSEKVLSDCWSAIPNICRPLIGRECKNIYIQLSVENSVMRVRLLVGKESRPNRGGYFFFSIGVAIWTSSCARTSKNLSGKNLAQPARLPPIFRWPRHFLSSQREHGRECGVLDLPSSPRPAAVHGVQRGCQT